MADDALEGAVNRDELDRFKARHPSFAAAATRLQEMLDRALNRPLQPVAGTPTLLQSAIFFLGHQAADGFFDIVLLAVHGYGMGALKLLRPLYERVVTALYLIKYPNQVNAFDAYGDIHAGRFVNRAKKDGLDLSAAPAEWLREVEKAYEAALPSFTDAPGRVRGSWTELNLEALARKVGLETLYAPCALWPTMQLHTTRAGLDARLRVSNQGSLFTHEPQPDHADYAVKQLHDLIVYLLGMLNDFFGWHLDLRALVQDVQTCWGTTT
jgi:Family of unknown function (DUF5677)